MMLDKELIALFVAKLGEQGFNLLSITPYLELTWREYDKDIDTIGARFEVRYPGLIPICQYVGFDIDGNCKPRDEWFISLGGCDKIFGFEQNESQDSFYSAFKYVSTSYVLKIHLQIAEPWQIEAKGDEKE